MGRAVAEAWVRPDRKHLYASSEGLGQSFSFDILLSAYERDAFKRTIVDSLAGAKASKSSTTWVFSSRSWLGSALNIDHDVVRHVTRYGLPTPPQVGNGHLGFAKFYRDWLSTGGTQPECDLATGLKRAKAATLMMLALPGSAYIYQ
jgi:alpha-glucosidase